MKLKKAYSNCMECGGKMKMKSGGKWIKSAIKKPGSFTAQAKKAGMSVPAFRDKVLANKEKFSSTTVKRANLAKTLSKMKKGQGGMMVPGVNGTVMASTPMPKKGQSFTSRKPGSANLKGKAKSKLKKK
jgi:hypothetical protein